ncbi:MAG: hypothetical protein IPN16_19435 [Gemmatimonadetes bacterium]|nr:hypothetical protein [Gemmatimonadota bacterium]
MSTHAQRERVGRAAYGDQGGVERSQRRVERSRAIDGGVDVRRPRRQIGERLPVAEVECRLQLGVALDEEHLADLAARGGLERLQRLGGREGLDAGAMDLTVGDRDEEFSSVTLRWSVSSRWVKVSADFHSSTRSPP